MEKIQLKAVGRKLVGKKVRRLRREGILPANIYGKKIKSVSIQVNPVEFEKVFKKAGETGLVEVEYGKEVRPVLIHNIQFDPETDKPLHVDFLQVDLKQKVTAEVPIETVGESPAEKQGLGTVVLQLGEIEVEALPMNLPEKFEVDISVLTEVDQAVYVKDLKYNKEIVTVTQKPEEIIIKVEAARKEEEEPVAPVEEVEAEGTTEAGVEGSEEGKVEEAPPQEVDIKEKK